MKLDYSDQAARQAVAIDEWWVDNRPKNRALFGIELLAAEDAILLAPYGRPVHRVVGKIEVRRFPMPRTRHHLYYLRRRGKAGCPHHLGVGRDQGARA